MVNGLIGPITLNAFGLLDTTNTGCVSPFPAIFALQDIWIHIYSTYSSNKASNIEVSVDNCLSFGTVLCIPDFDPDYSHI